MRINLEPAELVTLVVVGIIMFVVVLIVGQCVQVPLL